MRAAPAVVSGATVAHAMITAPKLCEATATAGQAHAQLDRHVHALLVVSRGRLVAVIEHDDLVGSSPGAPAAALGHLAGRTVGPDDDLAAVTASMTALGRRRLAVVDDEGRLLGLLCRKRSGRGFCSDEGVAARVAERAAG